VTAWFVPRPLAGFSEMIMMKMILIINIIIVTTNKYGTGITQQMLTAKI
jgi:hypothetical protein